MLSESDFFWFCAVLVAVGFGLALVLFFGVPWLWGFVKPFIHMVTA